MVSRTEPLSIVRQCELLALPRSTSYHVPKPVTEEERVIVESGVCRHD